MYSNLFSYTLYMNSGYINLSQIKRNSEAKNLLWSNGIKEDKTINCINNFELIKDLKERCRKTNLEYPIIEIRTEKYTRFIGNLYELRQSMEGIKKEMKEDEEIPVVQQQKEKEKEKDDDVSSCDELLKSKKKKGKPVKKNQQVDLVQKIQQEISEKKSTEEIKKKEEEKIDVKEEEKPLEVVNVKEEEVVLTKEQEEKIDNKLEEKKESIESVIKEVDFTNYEVGGLVSYPLHLLENSYKKTVNGIGYLTSFLWRGNNQKKDEKFVEIPVNKTNWYGRVQKRVLKVFNNRIERYDVHNNLRQTLYLKDLSKFVITDSDFFYLMDSKGSQELYRTPKELLDQLLDLFKTASDIYPKIVIEIFKEEKENEEPSKEDEKDK